MVVSAKSPFIHLFFASQSLASTFPAWSLEDDIVRHREAPPSTVLQHLLCLLFLYLSYLFLGWIRSDLALLESSTSSSSCIYSFLIHSYICSFINFPIQISTWCFNTQKSFLPEAEIVGNQVNKHSYPLSCCFESEGISPSRKRPTGQLYIVTERLWEPHPPSRTRVGEMILRGYKGDRQ